MSDYIIFERINDPRSDKPVEIHDDRWDAESRQLALQQEKATAHNQRRKRAFKEGRGFAPEHTIADYKHDFKIEEVK